MDLDGLYGIFLWKKNLYTMENSTWDPKLSKIIFLFNRAIFRFHMDFSGVYLKTPLFFERRLQVVDKSAPRKCIDLFGHDAKIHCHFGIAA